LTTLGFSRRHELAHDLPSEKLTLRAAAVTQGSWRKGSRSPQRRIQLWTGRVRARPWGV